MLILLTKQHITGFLKFIFPLTTSWPSDLSLHSAANFFLCYCCDSSTKFVSEAPGNSFTWWIDFSSLSTSAEACRKTKSASSSATLQKLNLRPPSAWLSCQQPHWQWASLICSSSEPCFQLYLLWLSEFRSHCRAALLTALTGKQTRIKVQQSLCRLMTTMTESKILSSPARGGWMWPSRRSDTSTASCTEAASSGPSVRCRTSHLADHAHKGTYSTTLLAHFAFISCLGFCDF